MGELVGRIHALPFEGDHGFLGDDLTQRDFHLPALGPTSSRWSSFFHCDAVAQQFAAMGYLDNEEAAILAGLPSRLAAELELRPCRLLHMGDLMHTGNVLVDPRSRRIRAILDYTESMAGDPQWELAWIRYYFADYPFERPRFDLARFWSGYGGEQEPDQTLARFYLMAVLLFEKLGFYEADSARGRWAIATVKRVLRSFG